MKKYLLIGGESRPIDFNFNCLEEFEEISGVNALNGLKGHVNSKNMKLLIFCGLKYGLHPEGIENDKLTFSPKTVGAWLTAETISGALAVFNAQGPPEGTEKKSEAVTEPMTANQLS
jgi:hypothetical protein